MAILDLNFKKIHEFLKISDGRKKAVTLGYPDFVPFETTVKDLLKEKEILIDTDPNYEKIKATHAAASKSNKIYNLIDILDKVYNFDTTVFDVDPSRGIEEIVNLNDPIDNKFVGKFDCVIDASVLEHCFNVGQAFKNLCGLCKVGGIVSTVNPIYMLNHGYYNVNPIMLYDGFVLNGFEILYQGTMNMLGEEFIDLKRKTNPIKLFNLVIARKIEDKKFIYPIQTHKGKIK